MPSVDWSDPCKRARALRDAYYALVAGDKEVSFQYQQEGALRAMTFQKVDMARLDRERQSAEAECLEAQGKRSRTRRFAITAGDNGR